MNSFYIFFSDTAIAEQKKISTFAAG